MNKERTLPIMELFGVTIQGEGLMTGTLTHFLRTGGCGLRCRWCDSLFAVKPRLIKKHRTMMTTADILTAVAELPPAPYITFTGGDPCLHKGLGDIIPACNMMGMRVAVETQGQLFPTWLEKCDVITFSPKGPSSGNTVDIEKLVVWLIDHTPKRSFQVCIKIVVFNQADFDYALGVYKALHTHLYDAFYFTAGTPMKLSSGPEGGAGDFTDEAAAHRINDILNNQQVLAELILDKAPTVEFNDKVHLGCQQHVLLWPTKDKGV